MDDIEVRWLVLAIYGSDCQNSLRGVPLTEFKQTHAQEEIGCWIRNGRLLGGIIYR